MSENTLENIIFGLKTELQELKEENETLKQELEKTYEIERANIQAEIADAGTSCHWCQNQTVKNTAKKIYLWLEEKNKRGMIVPFDMVLRQLKEQFYIEVTYEKENTY